MTITAAPELRTQLTTALTQVRASRHQIDCMCGQYRGYCTPEEKLWSNAVDRILDTIRRNTL